MTKQNSVFIYLILILNLNSCSQNQKILGNGNYSFDSKISEKVNAKLASIVKGYCAMDYKIFLNDSLQFDSDSNYGSNISRAMAILSDDTIKLYCGTRDWINFGFQIFLFGDSCFVKHFNGSNDEIYKCKKSDSLTNRIIIDCKSFKLTLASKPKFKVGEMIEGMIELTSDEYFILTKKQERRYQVKLTGYFKEELFQNTVDYYNSYK